MTAIRNKKPKVTVRTYRHGLGDCHLVTLYGTRGSTFRILIDCGVILGTKSAAEKMTKVMEDILQVSDGKVDLLVVTHEHWDHVSGFLQAKESFAKLQAEEIWMGWTENPDDKDAKILRVTREADLLKLQAAAMQMHINDPKGESILTSMLEFFGAVGTGMSTKKAMQAVRSKETKKLRYCDPADPPTTLSNFKAQIYVLGPPRQMNFLKKISSSKSPTQTETYSMAALAFDATVGPLFGDASQDGNKPFTSPYRIPLAVSKSNAFFQKNYWESDPWRRIDGAWMNDADAFALALDNLTNNTSLVLAIDIENIGVLLFAADAQVGNWLSWSGCKWTVNDKEITGVDLLKRTVFYKVGHHGSWNATLRDEGLSLMEALNYAVIPVDHDMALKKNWGKIPLGTLQSAIEAATKDRGFVLRTDEEPSEQAKSRGAKSSDLFFDVDLFN